MPHRVMESLFLAELRSNATFALQTHGDTVMGPKLDGVGPVDNDFVRKKTHTNTGHMTLET